MCKKCDEAKSREGLCIVESNNNRLWMNTTDTYSELLVDNNGYEVMFEFIKYCPFCGKKLKEEEE